MIDPASALMSNLTHQLRWHKTLSRLYQPPAPDVDTFLAVGKGAKGLGVMLRGEVKKRSDGPIVRVKDFGFGDTEPMTKGKSRGRALRL